jgi:hypothetical protein
MITDGLVIIGSTRGARIRSDFNIANDVELNSSTDRDIKLVRRFGYVKKVADARRAARRPFTKVSHKSIDIDDFCSGNYEPHFGLESIASTSFALEALTKFSGLDISDHIYHHVESLFLLLANLTYQTSAAGVITSVMQWIHGKLPRSVFLTVKEYICDTLSVSQSSDNPAWLECLRDARQNWELCKSNRAFKQISKLLGCLVSLGLCEITKVTFSVGKFNILVPEINDKHNNAFDIADAIFETVIFFTEGAYLCYQSGSIKPLLINDRTALELDHEYARVMAWYELARNGNLDRHSDISEAEFDKRLNRLSTSLRDVAVSLKGLDKKLVMDKYQKILIMQNDYVALKVASGVRKAPWAVSLFGESSQGKTMLGDQLIDALLVSQDLPIGKQYRAAYNPNDRYMSNWTSDKLVLIFDDVANTKAAFVEKPPTDAIINVINNQMFYAPKAELEAKGKCFVEPYIVLATTNTENLAAGDYSNCPYSIQRRLKSFTVKAKPEFQIISDGVTCGIDTDKVKDHYTVDGVYTPPLFDDIWTVDINEAVKPQEMHQVASYKPVEWNGKKMIGISFTEAIQWSIESFDSHIKKQDGILLGMKNRQTALKKCAHPKCVHLCGNCPYHPVVEDTPVVSDFESQFGKETVRTIANMWWKMKLRERVDKIYDEVDHKAAQYIYTTSISFLDTYSWVKCIPATWLEHPFIRKQMFSILKHDVMTDYNSQMYTLALKLIALFVLLIAYLPLKCMPFVMFTLGIYYLAVASRAYVEVEEEAFKKLRSENMQISPMLKRYRDEYAAYLCAAVVGIASIYGLARAYRAYKLNQVDSQGSLEPKSIEDIVQRDNETNVWTSVSVTPLPVSDNSKRAIADHIEAIVHKSLLYGTVNREEGNAMLNGLMITSNVILIPTHYFKSYGDQLDCTFRKKNPESSGGKFATRLHRKFAIHIEDTDLSLCYTPNGGSFKNLIEHFPIDNMPAAPFRVLWRNIEGVVTLAKGFSEPGIVSTYMEFVGGRYRNLSINTFQGMCGATLISETQGSVIMGMHLGGIADTPQGCYGSITQSQLLSAIDKLKQLEGVLITGSASEFKTTLEGVQITVDDPLHKKSPLNYLPQNSQFAYYGSCIGRSVTKSDVRPTIISKYITDVCGYPNVFRGPKFNPDWYGWQECLANAAIPALPYPPDLLEIAVLDYKESVVPLFTSSLWSSCKPLTDQQNINGIKGVKFIDAINLNTSMGIPFKGKKRKYVIDLEPTDDWPSNREFEPVIMDEIQRVESCYKLGVRANVIAKACKKDEILSKDKCRIMYASSISLTFLVRKYFLPLLRVLQMNPLVSECAVGINSHGPEWDAFYTHAVKHGMDRIIGGDYGKYDQKLPAQLILASLRILIDCARVCPAYTTQDISVMETMCGDIVYAFIAFNGDLIGLTEGTHISGNSLTVIINGICGSLNMRCYFYYYNPRGGSDDRVKFRDVVSIMTYGDDNIGSVSESITNFTIEGLSEFLRLYGQVYTMPDKDSVLTDFLDIDSFEFLKRKNVYHPALGVNIGALLDKSIYKSLHCYLRPKNAPLTPEQAAAQNIDGALREWFNHGEDKYEQQRQMMKSVAERASIAHICVNLDKSYADFCAEWLSVYRPEKREA